MMTTGYRYIAATSLVTEGKGLFYGFTGFVSDAADTLTLYDGLDETSGRIIGHWELAEGVVNQLLLPTPIPFDNGLHAVLSANDSRLTILFEPERGFTPATVEEIAQAITDLLTLAS